MDKMKIDHIGVIVKDIEKSTKDYIETYGFVKKTEVIEVKNQGVKVVLLNCGSQTSVELIQPLDEKSPSYNAMKRGGGINHICYETALFDEKVEKFESKIVRSPRATPEELFGGRRTFFIYRKHELIEFLEA